MNAAMGGGAADRHMAPYFGPGVPHQQWIWVDDLRIYTEEAR